MKKFYALFCTMCLALVWQCVSAQPLLLQRHDAATIRAVLAHEAPELPINSMTLIASSWDNIVADVNGDKHFVSVWRELTVSSL